MTTSLCRVELFGGLRLVTPAQTLTHFRTRKTALLLAYLSVHLHQTHPRETLVDLLWEDSDLETGRTSLRVALSSLHKQFEQAGVPPGEVFSSDHFGICLRSSAVSTDLREMEQNIRLGRHAADPEEAILYLQRAIDPYDVPLQGFYEEWVLQLQQQVQERYFRTLDELVQRLEQAGRRDDAQEYALRGIACDPLREEPRMALMRIYLARGYPMEARRVYQGWEQLVHEVLDADPSRAMQQLSRQAEADAQQKRQSVQMLCESALPSTPARLFGREREVTWLMEQLRKDTSRLTTITGEGGLGKTALATEVARRLVGEGRRTWMVDASEVRHRDALLEQILHTLGAAPDTEGAMSLAIRALGGYPSVLVLDNFEQMDPTGVEMVSELLQALPLLQILVTSRRRLGIQQEQVLRLRPLEAPPVGTWCERSEKLPDSSALEQLGQYPCVQLFVQQAQTVRAGFQLTRENAAAVADICRCLEGVPLAIVLAASRTRVLSPSQIFHAIQQQMDVLSAPHALPPERHRSLHAALEWSYDLLSPELKQAFTMFAVFRGGWGLAGATSVMTGAIPAEGEAPNVTVLDTLDALIESSLVHLEEQGGEARYWMLEVVRRYALEKLQQEPYAEEAFARHFLFYSQLAACANQGRLGVQGAHWRGKVALEHQNMIGAIEYALHRDVSRQSPVALRMAANLWVFWMMQGFLVEGRQVLSRLITAYEHVTEEQVSHWWAWAAMGAGALAWMQRDLSTAEPLLRQCLHRFQQEGDSEGQAFAAIWLGNVLYRMGEVEQAEGAYVHSMAMAEEAQSLEARTYATMWMGNLAQRAGDRERALRLYRSCLQVAEQNNDLYALGFVHYNLGQIALHAGDSAECAQQLLRCLRIRAQLEDRPGFLEAMESFAALCTRTGHGATAAQLLGASASLRQSLHLPPAPHLPEAAEALRQRMDEEVYQQHAEQGRSLSLWEALALMEALTRSPSIFPKNL